MFPYKHCVFIFFILFGCVSAQRTEGGKYNYWQCVTLDGVPSVLLDQKVSYVNSDSVVINWQAIDLSDSSSVQPCLILQDHGVGETYINCDMGQDSTGVLVVPTGKYKFRLTYIGCSDFSIDTVSFTEGRVYDLTFGLGPAGGFFTLDLSSEKKLMKWQIKSRANKWRRAQKKEYAKFKNVEGQVLLSN